MSESRLIIKGTGNPSEALNPFSLAFVGNSFTYFNDLPGMFEGFIGQASKQAGESHPVLIRRGQLTKGGQHLGGSTGHVSDPKLSTLFEEKWNVVVVQDNSQVPAGGRPSLRDESHEALRDTFAPSIVAQSAKAIVYSTWGHRDDGSVYERLPQYQDFVTMNQMSQAGCLRYAEILRDAGCGSVVVAPVGLAFGLIHRSDPALHHRLYTPDAFHPSRLGTYLAVCVLYAVITQQSPVGLQWIPGGCAYDKTLRKRFPDYTIEEVTPELAKKLQEIAQEAVVMSRGGKTSKPASL